MEQEASSDQGPRWEPLPAIERRVLGVLVEKAKTTPENYPLSLNGIRTGSNQKSNRSPQMQLEEGDLLEALDALRERGAMAMIQGDGRVEKFRHLAYDWLGVDKVELAVMAELLLRGDQTVGELRGRAARMDPIADLAALRPVLASLKEKGLIVYLTPEGRGCVVTHNLYLPQQMEKLRAQYGTAEATLSGGEPPTARPAASSPSATTSAAVSDSPAAVSDTSVDELRLEVAELRGEVERLKQDLSDVASRLDDALGP